MTRRAVRADGMSLAVRTQRKGDYIPCTMTTNNADWERGWFYLRNAEPGLPLHRQGAPGEARLLVPRGVPAPAPVAVGLAPGCAEEPGGPRADCGGCSRPPPPPAGRPFDGEAAPHLRDDRDRGPRSVGEIAAAVGPLLREYAATRARRAIDPKSGRYDDKTPWELEMLPTSPLVSGVLDFISNFASFPSCRRILTLCLQMVSVSAMKSEPPTPRSRALVRAA
jgi:hypothetical protein